MSEPDDTNDQNHDWTELAEVADEIEATYVRTQRLDPRQRRALAALIDLGAPVPKDWIRLESDGRASFGELTPEAFDKLVCLLEDLAEQRPTNVVVLRSGPTLFDAGGPEGPAAPPATSTVHLSIPG